jgi:C-terminal processing protease CtpA/Prc
VFRIPRTGVFTSKGINMEKQGVVPDVLVETHPDQMAKGVDRQLDRAVEVLRTEVVRWKKKNSPGVVVKPGEGKPMPMTPK